MSVVHLGVIDVAYTEDGKATTTGQVAEILEANYAVMQTFVDLHEGDIADALADRMAGLLETSESTSLRGMREVDFPEVDRMFRDYLDAGEWERVTGNAPTIAAATGYRSRKKHPTKQDQGRPSFIDTGLYRKSFRTWADLK